MVEKIAEKTDKAKISTKARSHRVPLIAVGVWRRRSVERSCGRCGCGHRCAVCAGMTTAGHLRRKYKDSPTIRANRVFYLAEQEGLQTACIPGTCDGNRSNYFKIREHPQNKVVVYADVPTDDEQAMMSAVALQPVSIAIEADQSSIQPSHQWCGIPARGGLRHRHAAVVMLVPVTEAIMVQRTSLCTQQVKSPTPLDSHTRPVQAIPQKASVLMRIGLAAHSMWPGLAAVVRTFSLGAGSEGRC